MGRNPFKDRPEASMRREMLQEGQRVLIVEKHKQGVKTKEELTEGYIHGFLTSKPHHPQGLKVSIIRLSYLNGQNIFDIDPSMERHAHRVGTQAGDLDVNQYAIGRVQYLVESENDIHEGDIVQITKAKNIKKETDLIEGVVFRTIQSELIEGQSRTMVELCDGTIGWVQKVLSRIID